MVTKFNHTNPYRSHSYNQHLLDPTIIFDTSGKIKYYNSEFKFFFDYPKNSLNGKNIKVIIPDFSLEKLKSFFKTSPESRYFFNSNILSKPILIMLHAFYLQNKFLQNKMYFCAQMKPPSPSVLVIEDSLTISTIMKRLFERNGCTCETAENGKIALSKFNSERKSSFDFILTDYEMPEMDGIRASKKIRKKHNTVPIVLNTSNNITEDFKQKCKKIHIQEVLPKPFSKAHLSPIFKKFNFPIK